MWTQQSQETEDAELHDQDDEEPDDDDSEITDSMNSDSQDFKDEIFEFLVKTTEAVQAKYTATDETQMACICLCEDGERHSMTFAVKGS